MAKTTTIKERDTGFKKFFENTRNFNGRPQVEVGFFSDSSQLGKAAGHEFGIPGRLPQRSFIRAAFDTYRGPNKRLRDAAGKFIDSGSATAMKQLGEDFRKHIIRRMDAGIPGKGGEPARFLEETGALKAAIEVKVTPGGR